MSSVVDKEILQTHELDLFKAKLIECNNLEELDDEFSKLVLTENEIRDIIEFMFKFGNLSFILFFLDRVQFHNPSFSLSIFDRIREDIIKDTLDIYCYRPQYTNNDILIDVLTECELDNEENIAACHELAYLLNHSCKYGLNQTPIQNTDYNLNFLWVNLNPQDRINNVAQNIFGDGTNVAENVEYIKDLNELKRIEQESQSLRDNEAEEIDNLFSQYRQSVITETLTLEIAEKQFARRKKILKKRINLPHLRL